MIPSPGELFADWWTNTAYEESGYDDVFYHDVPSELAAEARRKERGEDSNALREPWPLEAWPDTPTPGTSSVGTTACFPRRLGAPARPRAPRHRAGQRWTAATTSPSADRSEVATARPMPPVAGEEKRPNRRAKFGLMT
jgi:hypothetical protein